MSREKLLAAIDERNAMLDRVRGLLIENLGVRRELDELDPDTPLFGTGLALDSIDAVELLVSVEAEFDVRIMDEQVARAALRTLNTIVDTVVEARGATHG